MANQEPPSTADEVEQPLVSHLKELRDRLLRIVLCVLAIFLVLMPFANNLYEYLAGPLLRHLPEGSSMVAIDVASPFFAPFKLTLVAALFLAMPIVLYQVWSFIAPGLYRHEKKLALPLFVSSVMLFFLGAMFAYFVVFPIIFGFFVGTAPGGVAVMTDISKYLDFVLTLFFAFGLAFEVPIAIILAVKTGLTTPQTLTSKRPYIVVGAFVLGMFLTPPDAISQTLLAVPIWILFEIGVQLSKLYVKEDSPQTSEEEVQ